MKKVVVLALIALAVWLGVNYMRTGTFSLLPASVSPAEKHLHDLEEELTSVNTQIEQAGRAAGLSGVDSTAGVAELQARKEKLEKEIAAARQAGR